MQNRRLVLGAIFAVALAASSVSAAVVSIDASVQGLFTSFGQNNKAYNAGPGNLRRFRREAEKMGLDPNIWFNNVEQAAARIVGQETVQYVGNIYKYYVAYALAEKRQAEYPCTQSLTYSSECICSKLATGC